MRRRPAPRRPTARRPVHRPDPFHLGQREAERDVPKTSSVDWVAEGGTAAGWFDYSRGYDGVTQASAPPMTARLCELAEDIAAHRSMTLAEAEAAAAPPASVRRRR